MKCYVAVITPNSIVKMMPIIELQVFHWSKEYPKDELEFFQINNNFKIKARCFYNIVLLTLNIIYNIIQIRNDIPDLYKWRNNYVYKKNNRG